MKRIHPAAVAEGVVTLVSAAAAEPGGAEQRVAPSEVGAALAERAAAEPFVRETLACASSLIAESQGTDHSSNRTPVDMEPSAADCAMLPLFAYEDPDDGTVRVLC